MIVKRETYIDRLCQSRENGLIKIITGLRRSGKSFLLKKLYRQYLLNDGIDESHIIIIDMESQKNKAYRDPDYLLDYIEKKMVDKNVYYIIIDEVQQIIDFPEVLSSLAVIDNADVYVTGANSHLLSSDVLTEFRGRGDEIHLWPLSFKEFMSIFDGSKEDGWTKYVMFGGLPELLAYQGDDRKIDFLRRIYRAIYLKDIDERYTVELKSEFEELSKVIASNIGAKVSSNNIANTFKSVEDVSITDKTISLYISYMQESFLIEKAERYDVKGRKYIGSPYKYYYQDVGLRNAILGFRLKEDNHLMENIIFNEMRMRGWSVDIGDIHHVRRNPQGKQQRMILEVDFVCNKGSERIYIQSAWRISDYKKMEQEKQSLRLVDNSFLKLLIIGEHTKPWKDENGILTMSIYDFLLNWNI